MTDGLIGTQTLAPVVNFGIDEALARADWKRDVGAVYQQIRATGGGREAWDRWREVRQWLHATHPQSPVPEADRPSFRLAHFEYDPEARVLGEILPAMPEVFEIDTSGDRTTAATRMATVAFTLQGREMTLGLYWLEGYRGGLFLPFRDETSGSTTYGAGRYLLDTMKAEDQGVEGGLLVLDFNFAYHPPCFYNHNYSCPLAPPENRLPTSVEAGERTP
jgi:uncharacterized protein (DUF1684 family)